MKGIVCRHNTWEPRENIYDNRLFEEYMAHKKKLRERKRSSTISLTKKMPKRSKRLAQAAQARAEELKDEEEDDDDFDNSDIEAGDSIYFFIKYKIIYWFLGPSVFLCTSVFEESLTPFQQLGDCGMYIFFK